MRELVEGKLYSVGVTPRPVGEARHHDAIKKLVERSVGYAMLIRASVEDDLAKNRLVVLELNGPPIFGEVVVTYRSQSVVSPLVREFIDVVRSELETKREATRDANASPRRRHRATSTTRSTRRRNA